MSSSVVAPHSTVTPPPIPADKLSYTPAGFWVRTLAHIIDSIILSALITPLLAPLLLAKAQELVERNGSAAGSDPVALLTAFSAALHSPLALIIQYVIPGIAVILLWKWRSATPGKMIFGLKIIDAETQAKPSTSHLVIRFFAYLVSMAPFFFGFLRVGWDPCKQGWHDKLANTLVVTTKQKPQ